MSLSRRVTTLVRKAFNLVGDIAKNVTLSQKTVESFDFATGNNLPNPTVTTTSVVKAIILSKKRFDRKSGSHSITTEIMFKTEDIEDMSVYDTVTVDNVVWRLVPPYKNDGYVITMTIVKET